MTEKSIKQKRKKNKTLLDKVIYRLLEVRGTSKPCTFWGYVEYRRVRSVIQAPNANMHISKIRWLSQRLDVPPQFIVNIVRRTLKGEEGLNIERPIERD